MSVARLRDVLLRTKSTFGDIENIRKRKIQYPANSIEASQMRLLKECISESKSVFK